MMIKIYFNLPYRMLEDFAKETLHLVKIPTYSLICKRAAHLHIPHLSYKRLHKVIIDANEINVVRESKWKIKTHRLGRPRKWIELHIAIDTKTQEIVATCTAKANQAKEGTMVDSNLLYQKAVASMEKVLQLSS